MQRRAAAFLEGVKGAPQGRRRRRARPLTPPKTPHAVGWRALLRSCGARLSAQGVAPTAAAVTSAAAAARHPRRGAARDPRATAPRRPAARSPTGAETAPGAPQQRRRESPGGRSGEGREPAARAAGKGRPQGGPAGQASRGAERKGAAGAAAGGRAPLRGDGAASHPAGGRGAPERGRRPRARRSGRDGWRAAAPGRRRARAQGADGRSRGGGQARAAQRRKPQRVAGADGRRRRNSGGGLDTLRRCPVRYLIAREPSGARNSSSLICPSIAANASARNTAYAVVLYSQHSRLNAALSSAVKQVHSVPCVSRIYLRDLARSRSLRSRACSSIRATSFKYTYLYALRRSVGSVDVRTRGGRRRLAQLSERL